MAKKSSISYRRDDTAPATGRLYDRFCRLLGRKHVFLDVGAIDAGENFKEKIGVELNKADVILVLIGKKWMDPAPGGDKPRLFNDGDHVGFELRAAMQGKAMKLPVLIDGAPMPPPHALPEEIAAISRLNAPPLRYETFDADADFIARKSLGLASGALLWDEPGIGRRIGNAIAGGFLALFAFIFAGARALVCTEAFHLEVSRRQRGGDDHRSGAARLRPHRRLCLRLPPQVWRLTNPPVSPQQVACQGGQAIARVSKRTKSAGKRLAPDPWPAKSTRLNKQHSSD